MKARVTPAAAGGRGSDSWRLSCDTKTFYVCICNVGKSTGAVNATAAYACCSNRMVGA
jgi:hypothetical protein